MARILHRTIRLGIFDIFYRETLPRTLIPGRPPILLLHGFPSSSFQYCRLMQALGDSHRMIAPDYPGFGQTRLVPGQEDRFDYSFEALSQVVETFIDALGLGSFVLYAFDFGGPVGFRIAVCRPELIAGLIIQNANAYEAGLTDAAWHFAMIDGHSEADIKEFDGLLSDDGIKFQYMTGVSDPVSIAPDGYSLDQHHREQPGHRSALISLLRDYKSNLAEYPIWQDWLRRHRPPAQILWGRNDPLFNEFGAQAYLADIPQAELHLFNTGHFALEECVDQIAPLISDFIARLGGTNP